MHICIGTFSFDYDYFHLHRHLGVHHLSAVSNNPCCDCRAHSVWCLKTRRSAARQERPGALFVFYTENELAEKLDLEQKVEDFAVHKPQSSK